mmetsp:Transcript_26151/g.34368  ORF Transcript_26151/g.34368 Transcript_26151/m.34368 type:complete len:296 (+) Transcript_26151:55-942(+)
MGGVVAKRQLKISPETELRKHEEEKHLWRQRRISQSITVLESFEGPCLNSEPLDEHQNSLTSGQRHRKTSLHIVTITKQKSMWIFEIPRSHPRLQTEIRSEKSPFIFQDLKKVTKSLDFLHYDHGLVVAPNSVLICFDTWKMLLQGRTTTMAQFSSVEDGLTLFTEEFFSRLFRIKGQFQFRSFFQNKTQRQKVLVTVMEFIVNLKQKHSDILIPKKQYQRIERCSFFSRKENSQISHLHAKMFIDTTKETIMFWLGQEANLTTEKAWSEVCSYVESLLHMLFPEDKDLLSTSEW